MAKRDKKSHAVWFLHLAGALFLTAGLTTNPLKAAGTFFSDEAVYYTMAHSFAADGDMDFERRDLIRTFQESPSGPSGIVLKINERDQSIVFGKSFLYSLAVSPFVRIFGTNGFLVFHSILLWLNLLCAYHFCSAFMKPASAAAFSAFYFLANASFVYLFWMTPEYFNMSLVCFAFYFFVTAENANSRILPALFGYVLSAFLFGMAVYSKPTNLLLVIPPGIWLLARKKILLSLLALSVLILTTIGLFGMNFYFTGEWNYQGGKRAAFYKNYPYERPGASEFAPFQARHSIEAMVRPPFYWKTFLYNWGYFFFGRYSGLGIYFFPMLFMILYFPFSQRNGLSTAAYIAGWIGILTFMIGLPWNYFGGSGTIGNRYLFTTFAVFLFSLTKEPDRKTLIAAGLVSILLTGPFLFSPVFSSRSNAFHQQSSLYRWLPIEKSLLTDIPVTGGPRARRVAFDEQATYFAYFMDDNTYYRETLENETGFWVQGGRAAELILRIFEPTSVMKVKLKSLEPDRIATVSVDGSSTKIQLEDDSFHEYQFNLGSPFPYDRDGKGATYLYRIKISSEKGTITKLKTKEERNLGVFVRIELPEAVKAEIPPEDES